MVDCDVALASFSFRDDPEHPGFPVRVAVLDRHGNRHVFLLAGYALTDDYRLKGRCTGADMDPIGVIFFAGLPPHEDGHFREGRDFWDIAIPAKAVRKHRRNPDVESRLIGRMRYLGIDGPGTP